MSPRRTRAETITANREAVLRAARREFERSGYHGAAVARIAEDAGFSEGVVYSQFGSKVDLFLAVLEASIEDRAAVLGNAASSVHGPEEMHQAALAQLMETLAWQATLIEFRVHAWRHPEVNARYRVLHERTIDNVARLVPVVAPNSDMAPRQVALALLAESTGIGLELLADPALEPDAVHAALTHALASANRERTT